ncbi:hypothetical protein FISHEDRAFT_40059 [Fistulina hepatica ATCC 64428]|uniref:Uncharacterized protein n=1 Tax=Fistulina hepatica ATCC 64428 TaxID=1128425 RepID=A0A0D7AF76_9AGAR|nr:hypothetical protein FISHEDRAFT_40059 [Fistulina hepatica ATCC 64428]
MATIGNATRIWEPNVQWTANSNCAVWNGRGVDVYVCLRDHTSSGSNAPPNSTYWHYLGAR